jgi:hypothetical protein
MMESSFQVSDDGFWDTAAGWMNDSIEQFTGANSEGKTCNMSIFTHEHHS